MEDYDKDLNKVLGAQIDPDSQKEEIHDKLAGNDGLDENNSHGNDLYAVEDEHDPWLKSLESNTPVSSKEPYSYSNKPKPAKTAETDVFKAIDDMPTIEIVKLLISKLDEDETPISLLNSRKRKRATKTETDKSGKEAADSIGISDLAHALIMRWENVYYMSREEIVESFIDYRCNIRDKSPFPRSYQFKWVHGDDTIYGPFSQSDILKWILHNYVSDTNPIVIRELDNEDVPLSDEWIDYKDSTLYKDVKSAKSKNKEESDFNTDDDPDDTLFSTHKSKKQRLIISAKDRRTRKHESDSEDEINPYN
ncbi:hypothetical protein BEWA_010240 [Theileria equi strain WA]|uniref:GYF domain-containing protein n=1 Tax=Theileria equi strain WA TaxID=1537102 RepID=L0B1A3_THEEQ|nr:hypothetical protein BEWA_010240 [Theileria equi strain WA]AFZ81610.1 hypothetical protein BEWA_010240 [Theileria equi strain WA]|eukprot:XP_004831276.1 hypothetical protein BEWA_010240 [Theileria equi strain WA]